MVKDGGDSLEARLTSGFRWCLTRPPQAGEQKRLADLYQQVRDQYAKTPKEALALATEPLGPLPAGMDAVDLAALHRGQQCLVEFGRDVRQKVNCQRRVVARSPDRATRTTEGLQIQSDALRRLIGKHGRPSLTEKTGRPSVVVGWHGQETVPQHVF